MNLDKHNLSFLYDKKIYGYLAVSLILGIGLMLGGNHIIKTDIKNSNEHTVSVSTDAQLPTYSPYTNEEEKLVSILNKVKDVGNVDVYINYNTTSKKIALRENDKNTEGKIVFKNDGSNSEPFITTEISPEIEGVIIVAQGGDNDNIVHKIKMAVSAALGIPIHKVNILKMK